MVDKGVQKEEAAVGPSSEAPNKSLSSVSHKKTSMTDFVTPLKQNSDPRISYLNAANGFESPVKNKKTSLPVFQFDDNKIRDVLKSSNLDPAKIDEIT